MKPQPLLRCALWLISLYTVCLGLLLNGPQSVVARIAANMLNYEQAIDPPLGFAVRMLGAYMIFFGVAVGLAAWNPRKNRAILSIASLFLVVRILQRMFYAAQLEATFGISSGRNWSYIGIMALLTALFLCYRWLVYREMHP